MSHPEIPAIQKITLHDVLPRAFSDDAERVRFGSSHIYLSNFSFERGKYYCVNATSGTGKTSLCSFVFGVRTDYEGSISFDSTDIARLSIAQWCEIRRSHISYMPQELEVFDELSALDNVLLKNRLTDCRSESEIRQMFERLGIANRIDFPAGRMSVGQKQRVALIRALCQPFDFIILDEPVSHLDAINNEICGEMILEAAKHTGAGIIFTSVGNPLTINAPVIPLTL